MKYAAAAAAAAIHRFSTPGTKVLSVNQLPDAAAGVAETVGEGCGETGGIVQLVT
jgi:lipoprotein-anchoring transpeptidase ErfK/SrfK